MPTVKRTKIKEYYKFPAYWFSLMSWKATYKAVIFSKLCKLNILSVNPTRKWKCARMLIDSNNENND